MTEDEAKTKWCPFARAAEPQRYGSPDPMVPVAAVNRGSDALRDPSWSPNTNCLASACMAWRWRWRRFESAPDRRATDEPAQRPLEVGPDWRWVPDDGGPVGAGWENPRVGYCGLAGEQK